MTVISAPAGPDLSVRKKACERYDVMPGGGYGWAIFLLSESGGVLSVLSDYGNWGYCWPNHGRQSFKHFLIEVDGSRDYIIDKFRGKRTDFDFDASVKLLRKKIGEAYRDKRTLHYAGGRTKTFDKKMCKEAIDGIKWLDDTRSSDDFGRQLYERTEFGFLDPTDIGDLCVKRDNGRLCEFLRLLWPPFIGELKREVAALQK